MRSFIVKIEKFFKMDTGIVGSNFDPEKRKLVIPLYQREYKWTNEKIVSLINDIGQRDKFLGIIILDEQDECYLMCSYSNMAMISVLILLRIGILRCNYGI